MRREWGDAKPTASVRLAGWPVSAAVSSFATVNTVPRFIRTQRLAIRPYQAADADVLQPILAASGDYLSAWLPAHVWEPVAIDELRGRLSKYAELFDDDVEWRYAVLDAASGELLGSVGLFPRDGQRRVPFADADRLEIGYWIRKDRSGEGLATEATRAVLDVAKTLTGITKAEIRCDSRNVASAVIPQRLGFSLDGVAPKEDGELQIWGMALAPLGEKPHQ